MAGGGATRVAVMAGLWVLSASVGGRSTPPTHLPIPPNHAPRARAGPDLTTIPGSFLRLDARASSDPEGDALTFAWNIVAGAGGGLIRPDDASAGFRAALPGTYVIELTVRDAGHLESNDVIVVDVRTGIEPPAPERSSPHLPHP